MSRRQHHEHARPRVARCSIRGHEAVEVRSWFGRAGDRRRGRTGLRRRRGGNAGRQRRVRVPRGRAEARSEHAGRHGSGTGADAAAGGPRPGETLEERATRLHRQAIIVDGHNDIPSVILASNYDLGTKSTRTHTDLARMKAGGITGEFFSIYVEGELADKPTSHGGGALRRAIDLIDVTYRQVERHPAELMLATTAADIRRAKREGKIAVLMGIEGGHAIENSLYALRTLYRLGCRYMTLTHSNTNEWADSAGFNGPPVVRHHGLSPFGEEVVHEMQRIGMLVDISHVSDETFWSVMKVAKAPVIASHSSSRAVADHRRNMTDDMLRGLAKNGGVAMVNFWSMFLSNEYGARREEVVREERQGLRRAPRAATRRSRRLPRRAREAARAGRADAQGAVLGPHRSHRSHGEGRGHRPRRPRLRLRRRRRSAGRPHRHRRPAARSRSSS